VRSTARVATYGNDELRASVIALGFEPVDEHADVVVVDLRERDAVERAAKLDANAPRVVVAGTAERELCAAIGADHARIVSSVQPEVLGPVLLAALPARPRSATRAIVVTATRGGLGRTLFAANLAFRLAATLRIAVVDATGTGAAAWWLRADAQPWSAIASLADELTPEQLAVLAEEVRPGLRVIGGASLAPDPHVAMSVIQAAVALDELVIVDSPLLSERITEEMRERADRTVLFGFDDACSARVLTLAAPDERAWVIASQSRVATLGVHPVFRCLPRDEAAIGAAVTSRSQVKGELGRAYDEIAELLRLDAS
jgi:hypothetical protein